MPGSPPWTAPTNPTERATTLEPQPRCAATKRSFRREEPCRERAQMAERWAENDKSAYLRSLQAAVDRPGVTDAIGGSDHPMLMISSDRDYVPLDQKKPYLDALPAMGHTVIDDARHGLPMQRPDAFNRAESEFLAAPIE